MQYVLLDNGHGNNTPGKRSPDGSLMEYEYNRRLTAAISKKLMEYPNIKPIIIVPELIDISLSTRVGRINTYCKKYGTGNCIMVSCHVNAAANGQWMNARGWSVWTTKGQNNSDKLATCLYEAAKECLKGQKIRTDYSDGDPDWESNFFIIKNSNCSSVLTESLFMDNKEDVKYLLSEEGFKTIVDLHVKGILDFIKKYRK